MDKPYDPLEASLRAFADTNYSRSREASKRDVARAREAIKAIQAVDVKTMTGTEIRLRQRYLQVLRERVQHPEATLLQLGARCKVNKDVYSARLKRAFAFADRMRER